MALKLSLIPSARCTHLPSCQHSSVYSNTLIAYTDSGSLINRNKRFRKMTEMSVEVKTYSVICSRYLGGHRIKEQKQDRSYKGHTHIRICLAQITYTQDNVYTLPCKWYPFCFYINNLTLRFAQTTTNYQIN